MKGIKYNMKFTSLDQNEIEFQNMLMDDIMNTLKTKIKDEYKIDMKVSKHMIYNLVHRPHKANKIVQQFCKISFSPRLPLVN
tara:strand:- start:1723 stop:1968 length:246 start_codon:yes stop_codon:yes gene_type:complete